MTLNINEWNKTLKVENVNHSPFENIFVEILNVYALMKKIFFFITIFFWPSSCANPSCAVLEWKRLNETSNFCVNLLGKTKKKYFENINVKGGNGNKGLWKTLKTIFTNKDSQTNADWKEQRYRRIIYAC